MGKNRAHDADEKAMKVFEIKYDILDYASDHMEKFYELARNMVEKGFAYLCTCSQEKIRKDRYEGKECECRYLLESEHLKRFDELFKAKEDIKKTMASA